MGKCILPRVHKILVLYPRIRPLRLGYCGRVPVVPVVAYTAVPKGKSWQIGYCGRRCSVRLGDENLRTMGFADAATFVLLEEPFLDHALVAYMAMAAAPDGNPLHVLLAHHAAVFAIRILVAGFDVHGVGAPCSCSATGDDDNIGNQTVHVDNDVVIQLASAARG